MIDEHGADRTRSDFAKLAQGATLHPSQRRLDDGWRAVRSQLHAKGWFAAARAPQSPLRRWFWAVPAAAALLGVVWFVAPFRDSAASISYEVSGSALRSRDGLVQATDNGSGLLRFSDGTQVELAAHSAARVAELTAAGANIRLQQGEAEFDVRHLANARWRVEAGPFVVRVTGTSFKVRWDAAREHFQIEMHSGSVSVDGPTLPARRALGKGETLDIVLRPEAAARDPQPTDPPLLDEPQRAAAQALPRSSAPAPSAPVSESWSELLARGKVKDVVAQAEAGGISQALATRGAADLAALADAARYTRQNDLARRALVAVRSRFSGSGQARDAAFYLGRLEESGAPARALEWYERYLMEAPSGTYAAEAMGRKMLVVERVRGREAALPLARDYLARFPKGSYASVARSLLGSR